MIIQKIPINDINIAFYNPRKDLQPGDPEYEKLKKSILEFDLVEPLIWNKKTRRLVGGHQRLKILKERGDSEVEVSVVDLDEVKEKALNLVLNKVIGEWYPPALKDLLEELDTGILDDIEITGFDDKEIEMLMTQFHIDDEIREDDFDAEAEAGKITVCKAKKGDIFQVGKHRLMCGDSTKEEDVEKLFGGGALADLIFTDPPYNVNYLKLNRSMRDGAKDWTYCGWTEDSLSREDYKTFLRSFISNAIKVSIDNVPFYIWFAFAYYRILADVLDELKLPFDKVPIIWKKQTMPISWARYHRNYEPCIYAGHGAANTGKKSRWFGPKNEKAVWEINTDWNNSYVHPTQKPIALATRAIKNSYGVGNIVLDLFGGSGSTLMACEQTDRICYMMELDPIYCDVIIKRWEDYTDKKAELINEGNLITQ